MADTENKPHFILTVVDNGDEGFQIDCDIKGTNTNLTAMIEFGVAHAIGSLYEADRQEKLILILLHKIAERVVNKIITGDTDDANRTH